jgi:hypothetical protein
MFWWSDPTGRTQVASKHNEVLPCHLIAIITTISVEKQAALVVEESEWSVLLDSCFSS